MQGMGEALGAGRKAPSLYTNHFTRIRKVANKGNRYNWRCNYCGDDENSSGVSIEGRDNALPMHLSKKKTSDPTGPATASPATDVAVIDVDEPEAARKSER